MRLRTKVTKGAGSRAAGLAMVFKLIESAQSRRRAVNGPHLVARERAGARFHRGVPVEREEVAAASPRYEDTRRPRRGSEVYDLQRAFGKSRDAGSPMFTALYRCPHRPAALG